jgi:hypothetical protein
MVPAVLLACSVLFSFLVACSGESPRADLPAGWESAAPILTFRQAECAGSALDPSKQESVEVSADPRTITVQYHNAHFRCGQALEGFVRSSVGQRDILVQPSDMNPSKIAGCDCLYELTMTLGVDAGNYLVSVSRRWDHKSGSDGVTFIGSALVCPGEDQLCAEVDAGM